MSADTTTALLQLLLQGTGNNNNSWGQNLNDQVIQLLENAIAGQTTITATGGTYNLTAAESRSSIIHINSVLTSDLTIVVPELQKKWTVINNCSRSGGFFVLMKTALNTINIPAIRTTNVLVFSTGTGARVTRLDNLEVGRYVYDSVVSADVQEDVLECDGSLYKRASLPQLFGKIGTTFGSTDSTNFRVPNAYDTGRFLRSQSAAVAAGTSQSNQNKSHTHTGSGTTTGQSATHTHTGSGTTTGVSANHTHTGSGTTSGASADHTHAGSGSTGAMSADHTHSGTTGGASIGHTHTGSGTTSGVSANATHTHLLGGTQNAFIVSINNGGGASQGNLVCTVGSISAGLTTSSTNTDHTHIYSFTTSDVSADHTHNVTTGGVSANHTHAYSFTTGGVSVDHTHTYSFTTAIQSVDHTHTYSFTTSTGSVDHTHTYSFTTSTGSADGTEARPESLVAKLCIRY